MDGHENNVQHTHAYHAMRRIGCMHGEMENIAKSLGSQEDARRVGNCKNQNSLSAFSAVSTYLDRFFFASVKSTSRRHTVILGSVSPLPKNPEARGAHTNPEAEGTHINPEARCAHKHPEENNVQTDMPITQCEQSDTCMEKWKIFRKHVNRPAVHPRCQHNQQTTTANNKSWSRSAQDQSPQPYHDITKY